MSGEQDEGNNRKFQIRKIIEDCQILDSLHHLLPAYLGCIIIDFRQARVTDAINWVAIDNDLWLKAIWPYNVPFVKGGPRAQVRKEVWGPQKQESQESAEQKQSMALVQKHTAI